MQGKRTEAAAVRRMSAAIRSATPATVRVTNYRKDKAMLPITLRLHPVKDPDGKFVFCIGVQV